MPSPAGVVAPVSFIFASANVKLPASPAPCPIVAGQRSRHSPEATLRRPSMAPVARGGLVSVPASATAPPPPRCAADCSLPPYRPMRRRPGGHVAALMRPTYLPLRSACERVDVHFGAGYRHVKSRCCDPPWDSVLGRFGVNLWASIKYVPVPFLKREAPGYARRYATARASLGVLPPRGSRAGTHLLIVTPLPDCARLPEVLTNFCGWRSETREPRPRRRPRGRAPAEGLAIDLKALARCGRRGVWARSVILLDLSLIRLSAPTMPGRAPGSSRRAMH